MKPEEFQKYEAFSVDDLFVEIAKETTGAGLLPEDRTEQVRVGKHRFQAIKELVVSKVCHQQVRSTLGAESDPIKLAAAIGDVLCSMLTGIPLVIVSMLIAKIGLDAFCPKPVEVATTNKPKQ